MVKSKKLTLQSEEACHRSHRPFGLNWFFTLSNCALGASPTDGRCPQNVLPGAETKKQQSPCKVLTVVVCVLALTRIGKVHPTTFRQLQLTVLLSE